MFFFFYIKNLNIKKYFFFFYFFNICNIVDYLGNVLEELGLSLSENLQHMSLLLRLSPEDYQNSSSGCNARLVAAVRQMRNITFSA